MLSPFLSMVFCGGTDRRDQEDDERAKSAFARADV
jgi:hypothetical protein